MPPARTRSILQAELGATLEDVFEWIDLEKPLGSASISQVRLLGTVLGPAITKHHSMITVRGHRE